MKFLILALFLSGCVPGMVVDISQQRLYRGWKSYPVSTAQRGIGGKPGSYKTPVGDLEIIGKQMGRFGPALIIGGVSRDGYQQKGRWIEIHGTSRELGVPLSRGCVTVSYPAARELYEAVPVGTRIRIQR